MGRTRLGLFVVTLVAALSVATPGWAAIEVVMNEVSRAADSTTVVVTFIDHSGRGITRFIVRDAAGTVLQQGELDCPRMYTTPPLVVPNNRFPLTAGSTECGEPGAAAPPAGYTNETRLELWVLLPVDPHENPCSEPPATREEGGTPCAGGRDYVRGIGEEIAALCAERERHRRHMVEHEAQMDAYNAATAVLALAALVCVLIASSLPWPANLILGLIAAALFIAALVTGSLAAYHRQEADHARRAMEEVDTRLEDARRRYQEAVDAAIRQCCGVVPTGITLDPPGCP